MLSLEVLIHVMHEAVGSCHQNATSERDGVLRLQPRRRDHRHHVDGESGRDPTPTTKPH